MPAAVTERSRSEGKQSQVPGPEVWTNDRRTGLALHTARGGGGEV